MRLTYLFLTVLCFISFTAAKPYRELLPKPDFLHGLVTAREVTKPTRANLDAAVWTDNALFFTPGEFSNNDSVSAIKTDLKNTVKKLPKGPWTALSFSALRRAAAIENNCDFWNRILPAFSNPETVIQRIWLNTNKLTYFIELQNKNLTEAIYAPINAQKLQESCPAYALWFKENYEGKVLNSEEVLDWAMQTASYWYPSLNTDLVWDIPAEAWAPNEKEAVAFLKGKKIKKPTLVIRGNPRGVPHYTVLSIRGMKPVAVRTSPATEGNAAIHKKADRRLPQNYLHNMETIAKELEAHGGSFEAWKKELEPVTSRLKKSLDSLPKEQMGLIGKNNWLFFRRSLNAMLAPDWDKQTGKENPFPPLMEFKTILESAEINMLFVPVPMKTEIYPEWLPGGDTSLTGKIINPGERWFVLEAQEQGMEIVDLLPPFLAARKQDKTGKEPLYQKDDTHWTTRGMLKAAEILAKRIKEYSWYAELAPKPARFSAKDTVFTRLGDIVERLPAEWQIRFPPAQLEGSRVYAGGVPYKAGKGAPIILIGDSFTGVMESVDFKNGGIGAHLARLTGLDVEVITSWGGGPNVRERYLKARRAQFPETRLVIYLMTARDLYRYPEGWEPLHE